MKTIRSVTTSILVGLACISSSAFAVEPAQVLTKDKDDAKFISAVTIYGGVSQIVLKGNPIVFNKVVSGSTIPYKSGVFTVPEGTYEVNFGGRWLTTPSPLQGGPFDNGIVSLRVNGTVIPESKISLASQEFPGDFWISTSIIVQAKKEKNTLEIICDPDSTRGGTGILLLDETVITPFNPLNTNNAKRAISSFVSIKKIGS